MVLEIEGPLDMIPWPVVLLSCTFMSTPWPRSPSLTVTSARLVRLGGGWFSCLDPAVSNARPPVLSAGTALSCAGGRRAVDAQRILSTRAITSEEE